MKKVILILIAGLLLSSKAYAFTSGKGEVKMTPGAVNHFIDYIQGKSNFKKKVGDTKPKPDMFILSSDGDWTAAWFCPYMGGCVDSLSKKTIKECERKTGTNCGVFASRRTLYWINGINTKKKKARFNSKMSGSEIRAKLTELGFIGDSTSTTTTTTPKITKKKKGEKKLKSNDDIVKKLKDLNDLYKSGVLTKEEFAKAKKKLLN